ncbi:MAG: GNAT family N-acetyltransferase [Coriobacteriia bacterium]|nr:GNAT family N-acetyltransferase [Coriobacteriia bacterium]
MNEKQTLKKRLPTGEEPAKGYESLAEDQEKNRFNVIFVMNNHLARSERAEIEALRSRALDLVEDYRGLTNAPLSLEKETSIIKDVLEENKMFALVYVNRKLAGYSLVVVGWPEPCKWLIQHMIIDPEMRHLGIGSAIVRSIEEYALESAVAADAVYAVPVQESGKKFWQSNGYTVEATRFLVNIADTNHELIVYQKEL